MKIRLFNPTLRAVGVISAVVILAGSATYALTSNSATLTSNTLSTASASLKIWDGAAFSTTATGFTVTDLVPGTGKEYAFYLKNDGGVPLALSAKMPAVPGLHDISGGLSSVKVSIKNDFNGSTTNTNLAALNAPSGVALVNSTLAAGATGNAGIPGTQGNFHITFDIDPAATTGSSASVDAFDIGFSGTQPVGP